MINEEIWNNSILSGRGDIEFDWFGIDQNGYLGVFSTFNRGFIPDVVKSSRIEYIELLSEIENLPFRYKAKLLTKAKGRFDDWLEYSQQGLIGFDYQDVHSIYKSEKFTLISRPDTLVTIDELNLMNRLIEMIPRFKLSFYREDGVEEIELKNTII